MNLQFTPDEQKKLINGKFDIKFFFLLWERAIKDNKSNWLILNPEMKREIAKAVYVAKGTDKNSESLTNATLSSAFSRWVNDLVNEKIAKVEIEPANKVMLLVGSATTQGAAADKDTKIDTKVDVKVDKKSTQKITKKENKESKANERTKASTLEDLVIHANNVRIIAANTVAAVDTANKSKGDKTVKVGMKKKKRKGKKEKGLKNKKLKF